MKMKWYTLFLSLLAAFTLQAQEVMQVDKIMSKGTQSAVSVEIENSDNRAIENWWREFAREYTKSVKRDRKSKEWLADDAEVSVISEATPVDLYTTVESAGKFTVVTTWVETGAGFINATEHPDQFRGLEALMQDFIEMVDVKLVDIELSDEEKSLKKLEGELKRLQAQNDSYHRDIENAKKKIEQAEENIAKNETEQQAKQAEIDSQLKVIDMVKEKKHEKEQAQKQ